MVLKCLACTLTKYHQQHQHLHEPCLGANVATCQYDATWLLT
jgi:hypothetical protein